jgi:hypothetical protein
MKIPFDTNQNWIYCYTCYIEGYYTKDYKLLNIFCRICKNNDPNNIVHYPSKIVDAKTPSIQEHKQPNYDVSNNQNWFNIINHLSQDQIVKIGVVIVMDNKIKLIHITNVVIIIIMDFDKMT